MNRILFVLLVFLPLSSYGQNKNDIIYLLPDSVEILVNNYMHKFIHESNFYCILKESNRIYELSVCSYKEKEKVNIPKYVLITNRKVLIGEIFIPIILDYDLKFGTVSDVSKLGSIGNREGYYKRQTIISHSPSIFFTDEGKISKCELIKK
jgi:hypothetical protein